MKRTGTISLVMLTLLLVCGCGSSGPPTYDETVLTQTDPIVSRVDPASGKAGDTVNIYGIGFSSAPGDNVVAIGPLTTLASGYALVPPAAATATEFEVLTVAVPSGATGTDLSVWVDVFDNVSNTNVTFTINP